MAKAPSQAVGVVEGTFIPERNLLIGSGGLQYPARAVASVRRFFTKHPDRAADARYFVCWPRTTKEGVELTVTDAPTDPDRQASLKREAGWFRVAGVVTNQRSRRNKVVVRVTRNSPCDPARKRQSEFRPHLLFLDGRVAPAVDFVNNHAAFRCQLKGQGLVIRSVESRQEIQPEPISAGGVQWPWPFYPNKASLLAIKDFNAPEQKTFLVKSPCQDTLAEGLQLMEQLIRHRKKQPASPEAALITDRLNLTLRRLRTYTARMGDFELYDLLEETGLHVILNRIQVTEAEAPAAIPAAAPAKTKPKAKTTPVTKGVQLPAELRPLADMLLQAWPDTLLRSAPGMSPAALKSGVAALVACGWYDALSPQEQRLAQASYQLKKALKLRS